MKKNYYEILEISKSSTLEEIKKSYRRLALKYHPDKNISKDSHDIFIQINIAYEILKDNNKRKEYDDFLNNQLNDKTKNSQKENKYNPPKENKEENTYHNSEYYKKAEQYANMSYDKFEKLLDNLVLIQKKVNRQFELGCGLVLMAYGLFSIIISLYSVFVKFEGFYVAWIIIHLFVVLIGYGMRVKD